MINSDYWHWYPNSDGEGIHFSFSKKKFATKFKKRFKTEDLREVIDITSRIWYCIKMIDQDEPNKSQFTWLKRCKIN